MEHPAPKRADGFVERGHQVTRYEAFVDAAFAFAVTLLVVSFDAVPRSVPELLVAMKGIPAFAVSFALLSLIWFLHNQWSRRYGLDDTTSVLLSLLLVFQVLVYVYPLKMMASSFMGWISGGALGYGFRLEDVTDIRTVYVVYGIAWSTVGINLLLFYAHAWRRRAALGLSRDERTHTYAQAAVLGLMPATGMLSVATATALPWNEDVSPLLFAIPGVIYSLMGLSYPVGVWTGRRVAPRVAAELAAASPSSESRVPALKRRRRRPRGPRTSA